MPKLNPETQLKANKKILGIILENYGLKIKSFTVAKNGIENTTFLIKTDKGSFALRAYRTKKKKIKDVLFELEFMDYLRLKGLPIPRIFANQANRVVTPYKANGSVWNCILMELMQGNHPSKYTDKLIKELATAQGIMHKLGMVFAKTHTDHKPFPSKLTEKQFLPKINLNKIKNESVRGFLLRNSRFILHLPVTSLPMGFNHGDFDENNILAQKDKLSAILDFDDLSYSPVALCLGYTLWDIFLETKSASIMHRYLAEYQKIRKVSVAEKKVLRDIVLFRHYIVGTADILFHGENNKYMPVFLKYEKPIMNLVFN